MGKDEMPGLVSVFLDEIDGAVAKIQTAANAAEDDLHFLKGCALTFGVSGLAALASDGEASVKCDPLACVDKNEIIAAYNEERAELMSSYPP